MTFLPPTDQSAALPRRRTASAGLAEPWVDTDPGFDPISAQTFEAGHQLPESHTEPVVFGLPGGSPFGSGQGQPRQTSRSRSGNPYFSSGQFSHHLEPQEERNPKEVMTYNSVVTHSLILLAVVIASAALTWYLFPPLGIVGGIVGMILAWVNIMRRKVSPALVIAYGIFEGSFLGFLSWAISLGVGHYISEDASIANSVVFQALIGTFITFAVVLMLFRSGRLQATGKFKMMLIAGFVSFFLLQLVSIPLMMTGILFGGFHFVLGIETLITLFAIGLAAFSLVIDFSMIQNGVNEGWPREYSWRAAFGLTLTLVWIYVEFLRLLAIFARRRR